MMKASEKFHRIHSTSIRYLIQLQFAGISPQLQHDILLGTLPQHRELASTFRPHKNVQLDREHNAMSLPSLDRIQLRICGKTIALLTAIKIKQEKL